MPDPHFYQSALHSCFDPKSQPKRQDDGKIYRFLMVLFCGHGGHPCTDYILEFLLKNLPTEPLKIHPLLLRINWEHVASWLAEY